MLGEIIKMIWPLLVLQFILQIISFVHLYKREQVRFNNKWIWVIIIIFGNILGPVAYFAFGGKDYGNSSKD